MMTPFRFARAATLALAAMAGLSAAHAGNTGTMQVSAVVEASCDVTAEPLTFVGARSRSAAVQAESGIRLRCSPDLAYAVRIDAGRNASGRQRRMIGGRTGEFLSYAIYSDAARTRPWDDGGLSGVAPSDGSEILIPAYGQITQGSAEPDTYNDTVTVSLVF